MIRILKGIGKKISTPFTRAQKRMKDKEVVATQKYIKKVWGNDTSIRKLSYQEIRKLGDELGMNIFNVKSFGSKNKLKTYIRICDKCGKQHKIERENKIRPDSGLLCPACRKEIHRRGMGKKKIRNKNKWEKLILDVLKKSKKGVTLSEICKILNCSRFPVWNSFKVLEEEKKIILFKKKMWVSGESPTAAKIVATVS